MWTRRAALALLVGALLVGAAAGAETAVDAVVVRKAKREMVLMGGGDVVRRYRIALGREPVGAKRRQGDGKTPEGEYTITGRNRWSSYHRSLRISYPNAVDRERARRERVAPGGDIMIHGLPNGRGNLGALHTKWDWTEGCIAVTNEEIEEIWRMVADGTPLRIEP